ncbi:uncharacterized protein LOC114075279 [Solanum pennellii]|uniref:Uncharacterized protein LOC114075279 n=1 Tax=Solanum pennellii TaxID=28526 RepID=A0ABM1V1F2_SOLPN|nr:uncharacterized protein LOC114075279 [Solanum pennellii]
MDPPQFQGGKSEDAHEFLTTCRELLEVVGLAESHGVRYATLQLRGPARDWWRTYSEVLQVGSPPVTWEQFASAFQDRFIPWSVREESCLRFESLRQDGLLVTEYEACFCQLSRHVLAIIPNETERIRRFLRGLTFSIRSAVFWTSREGASFQSIVSAAKEAELMERVEFGDPKRARISGKFNGASSGGRGSQRVSGSFLQRGPIHASMPTFEGGQTSRGSYGPGQGSYGSEQRPIGRGNYSGFLGSTQQFLGQRFCFTCGDPDHLMRQCTSQRGRGGPRLNSSFQLEHQLHRVEVVAEFSQVEVIEFLVVVLKLNKMGVEVPHRLEVDEEPTAMLSPGDLRRRPLMLFLQTVTLIMPGVPRVEWKSVSGSYPSKVISFIRAQRLVERGCLSYLAFIRDTSIEPPPMDSIPVVQEFLNVFPSDLPGVPPDRDIDFAIDLEPGTKPTSIPPYRKANVVADSLSRKTPSMGSLAAHSIEERPLARNVQILANSLVRLQIS